MSKGQKVRGAQAKFEAVLELLSAQKTADEICVERGVPRRSLYRRRQQLLEEGPLLSERDEAGTKAAEARIAEREQMVGRLTMEMAVLKKASGWLNAPSKKDER